MFAHSSLLEASRASVLLKICQYQELFEKLGLCKKSAQSLSDAFVELKSDLGARHSGEEVWSVKSWSGGGFSLE
jgi:hypothetical protein